MGRAYRLTNTAEKLIISAINILVAVFFAVPFLLLDLTTLQFKITLVVVFFLENLLAITLHHYRLPGMWLLGTHWKTSYPIAKQLIHAVLYSASFSTLLFWVWFPGDLLLLNLLCLQLPCVLATGTTFHGLIAGNMVDVKMVKVQKT